MGAKIDVLSIHELEILKAALTGDIQRQEKYLAHDSNFETQEKREEFEEWLVDTRKLWKKVTFKLMDLKSKQ